MRRRRLLTLLAGSTVTLSGCAGLGGLGSESTDEDGTDLTPAPVPDPTERPTGTADGSDDPGLALSSTADFESENRRLALPTRSAQVYSDSRLELGFERPPEADDVVLLRGRLSNESPEATTAELGFLAPFRGALVATHAGGSDATITLVPTPNDELATADLPTEGVDAGACRAHEEGLVAVYPENVYLKAGEVRGLEFRVCLGAADDDLPTGRYRFEESESEEDRPIGVEPTHVAVWDPSEPGPAEQSAFTDPTPPSLPERDVSWFHEADTTTTVWYRPSEERVTPPATVEFSLSNRSAAPIPVSRHRPRLFKLGDGAWHRIRYQSGSEWTAEISNDLASLTPGTTDGRSLCLAHGSGDACVGGGFTVGHLGGGRYAAVADLGEGVASSAALVDVEALPVTVEPSEDATVRERADGTVWIGLDDGVATEALETDEDGDGPEAGPGVTLILVERTDTATHRMLPEQAMQPGYAAVRDTLPFFEPGVDRVLLRSEPNPLRYAYPSGRRPRRFAFDGQAFAVRIDR